MESQKKVNWKVHLTKIPKFLRVPDWGRLLLEFAFLQSVTTNTGSLNIYEDMTRGVATELMFNPSFEFCFQS